MATFYDRFVQCAERWPDNVALELQRHDHLESCTYAAAFSNLPQFSQGSAKIYKESSDSKARKQPR